MARSIRDAFVAFCRAMREAEARFAIVGRFAVSAWGLQSLRHVEPRGEHPDDGHGYRA
jgi:hypothetical protein